jgi:membrane-associated phospholipid phosphatase
MSQSGINGPVLWGLAIGMIALPVLYFIHKLTTHEISNLDISNRKERIRPLMAMAGFILIDIIILSFLNNTFLLQLFQLYFLWILGFLGITIFWKISGHSGVATLAWCLLLGWYGREMWPFIFIVSLVSWARVVRRDHTLLQVIAGIIYSITIFGLWKIVQ